MLYLSTGLDRRRRPRVYRLPHGLQPRYSSAKHRLAVLLLRLPPFVLVVVLVLVLVDQVIRGLCTLVHPPATSKLCILLSVDYENLLLRPLDRMRRYLGCSTPTASLSIKCRWSVVLQFRRAASASARAPFGSRSCQQSTSHGLGIYSLHEDQCALVFGISWRFFGSGGRTGNDFNQTR